MAASVRTARFANLPLCLNLRVPFMREAAAWISLKQLVCVVFPIIPVRRNQFVLCPSSLEAAAQVASVAKPAVIKASPRVGMKSPEAPPACIHRQSSGPAEGAWRDQLQQAATVSRLLSISKTQSDLRTHVPGCAHTRLNGSANLPLPIYGSCLINIGSKRQTEAEIACGTNRLFTNKGGACVC